MFVRLIEQVFQVESLSTRQQLIRLLTTFKTPETSQALARRAVFDLAPQVRAAAVKTLKERPREEFRSVLLEALRYPWDAVASHAAEALVALDDQEALFPLVDLLDRPDPQAPFQDRNKKWVVNELVRVNHHANCLLCHAPASAPTDPVRGLIPERDKELPKEVVYDKKQTGDFIRADVTYLRQDFSVMQPVKDHGVWPEQQRFDCLVQQRELNPDEVKRLPQARNTPGAGVPSYPQREAVLWALRQLTGQDAGDRSEDWYLFLLGEDF